MPLFFFLKYRLYTEKKVIFYLSVETSTSSKLKPLLKKWLLI